MIIANCFYSLSALRAPGLITLCTFLFLLVVSPVRAEVTRAQVLDVAKELACLCGDCPRRPLHECACGWADKNRDRIRTALEAGKDKETIVAGFVSDFGMEAYSAPPAEGFNLTAWIMPFLALALGGFAVRGVIRTWSTKHSAPKPAQATESQADDPYLARIENELKERDS
ncbi:MAG: cytochrome c-type biogenesis protein CcmH [bacterium]|nr:cytochrome c-type biogenesis protein CcmH [bacterium]